MTLPTTGQASWGQTLNDHISATYAPVVVLDGTGIDLTGAVDCTSALRAKFTAGLAAGAKRFVGVHGATYKVAIPDSETLATFTSTTGITVDMSNSTLDNSATSYTSDNFTPMFLLDGATDTTILLREYVGFTLPTPATHHGYRGATLVRAINAAKGIKVDARATNLRYGVQSGEYGDATKGGCSGFDVKLRGTMIGYPIALYRAEGIRHDIDVDGVHRAAYIAGCDDVRGVVRWRDQYIADIAYLITDCLVSGTDAAAQIAPPANPTTSRGCSNMDVVSIDKGSTVFELSTACAGITLSRVDPVTFSNIRLKLHAGSATAGVSQRTGLFKVASGVKAIWNRYAFDWESTVKFHGIAVSGVLNHSAQTGEGNTAGGFYVDAYDTSAAHAATVSDFTFHDMVLSESSGNTRDLYWNAPGLAGPVTFRDCDFSTLGLNMFTNATVETIFDNVSLGGALSPGGSKFALRNSTIGSITAATTPPSNVASAVGGAVPAIRQKETTLTLTGASVSWASALPSGAVILGVQGRVGTAITGATGYQVGIAADLTRYVNTNTITSGSTFGLNNAAAAGAIPHNPQAATALVVTAKTSNFTAGTLRLIVTYLDLGTPTA